MRSYRNETKMVSDIAHDLAISIKWAAVFSGLVAVGTGWAVSGRGGELWLLVLAVGLLTWVTTVAATAVTVIVVAQSVTRSIGKPPPPDPPTPTYHPPPKRSVPVRNPRTGRYDYIDV